MTANDPRDALRRLSDALMEDILAASDEAILAEIRQDGHEPEKVAASVRALFVSVVARQRKARLHAAQAAVAAERQRRSFAVIQGDPVAARRRLDRLLGRYPEAARQLTLAARKANATELSNEEVLGWLEDFADLGISDPDPEP
jgi:hypothetical protein